MAVHADDVLAHATIYPELADALADCSIAVGTTSRRGGYRSRAVPLRAAAVELDALAGANKIALVFGREDRGLTNRELKLCHRLVTIPTAPEYPSLNLAQAVMVVAYELMMAANESAAAKVKTDRATHFVEASMSDPMLERMAEALVAIGFIPDDNPDHIMLAIREIFGRSGLTAREVEILNGDGAADAMGSRGWASDSGGEASRGQEVALRVSRTSAMSDNRYRRSVNFRWRR